VNEWVARTRTSETAARELMKILRDARPFNDFMTALKEPDKAELFFPAARPAVRHREGAYKSGSEVQHLNQPTRPWTNVPPPPFCLQSTNLKKDLCSLRVTFFVFL
jgi:hypothetical protein